MTRTTRSTQGAARARRAAKRADRRRGSVIILVVAVLAVLAIFAASYVTVSRLERASSVAYAQRSNFIQQRDAVVAHLQALLAADMFGGKIVTSSTPRRHQGRPLWPVMFEDGAWWDAPYVVSNPNAPDFTFNVNPPDQQPSDKSLLRYDPALRAYEVTYPDKAWLASTEPVSGGGASYWNVWPQITNLRSAYNWDPRANGGQGAWVRDHGRYLDLANFFASPRAERDRRGDPGAELYDLSSDPEFAGSWSLENAVRAGVLQAVYDKQMNHMQEWTLPAGVDPDNANLAYTGADLRMWVDTDGDGRPDARWQELDALGFALGLRWVIAARITDASAMLNVNASLEAGNLNNPSELDTVASGITPADVDLFRLLDASARSNNPNFPSHPDLIGFNVVRSVSPFMEHLTRGLNLGPREGDNTGIVPRPFVFSELHELIIDPSTDIDANTPNAYKRWNREVERRTDTLQGWNANDNWTNALLPGVRTNTTRTQREAYYRFVGVSPQASRLRFASPYPLTDEIDLRAHFGFNLGASVAKIEQRLDGPTDRQYNVSRLPGSVPDYPVRGSLGLLRSKEDMQAVRGLGETTAVLPGLNGTYSQQNKIARIDADVRRLLTTYSGVGYRSPVSPKRRDPVTGALAGPDSLGKVMLTGAPWTQVGSAAESFVRRSFESFAWALAPLAGDQPLLRGLQQGGGYNSHDFHYGGGDHFGVLGPARHIALENGNVDMGASYALLRALALAVNLKDAIDVEDPDSLIREERPTVVRFRNTLDASLLPPEPGVILLDRRMAHGVIGNPDSDADTVMLPQQYVGEPAHGVTLIGLEKQPFLRDVSIFTYYQDTNWDLPTAINPVIDPFDPVEQFGIIVAVEVGNPWHEQLQLDEYTFRLTDGDGFLDLPLDGELEPGRSRIFYYQKGNDSAEWDSLVEIGWKLALDARGMDVDEIALDAPIAGGTISIDPGSDPICLLPFHDSAEVRALLISGEVDRYIVDRMSPPTGEPFPLIIPDDLVIPRPDSFDPTNPEAWSGRLAVVTTLSRSTEPPPAGGFPAYIVERRDVNYVETVYDLDDDAWWQSWLASEAPMDPDDYGFRSVFLTESVIFIGQDKSAMPDLPPFQLFVPDGPMLTTSELHMLCKFAHMYMHDTDAPMGADDLNKLDRWTTIGEQLGEDAHFYYNAASMTPNPYLGVLDPSRFILGPQGDLNAVPMEAGSPPFERVANMLAVPLAVRVFDAFDALPSPTSLAQGRININTAPERVLRVLPLLDPRDPIVGYSAGPPAIGPWTPKPLGGDQRVEMISAYRNAYTLGPNVGNTPQAITDLPGLRGGLGVTTLGNPDHEGLFPIVSAGEVAIMGRWDPSNPGQLFSGGPFGFMELGESGSPGLNEEPLELRNRYGDPAYNPQNDPEERLALFRAISNIVSTRSDVFVMWFVLRGYDPAAIEAIEVPDPSQPVNQLAEYLNDLAPAYESRWLCVLDRSGVRLPTDRPRVILLVELPSTSP